MQLARLARNLRDALSHFAEPRRRPGTPASERDVPKPGVGLSGKLCLFGRGAKGITVDGRTVPKGEVAPRQTHSLQKPIGEWNVPEVACRDNAFEIKLHGEITVQGDNPIPRAGAIMLQSSTGSIEFRKLEMTVPEARESPR